ncbi:MAG: hypothetical protein ABI821_06795 [Pseudomonadota bacterium]
MRKLMLIAVLSGLAQVAQADILSVRAQPARSTANAGQDFALALTWQVTLDVADSGGARSAGGAFFNATTGAALGLAVPVITNFGGGGVHTVTDLIAIDGATLADWRRQGIRRVGYRRPFTSATTGRVVTGQSLIDVAGSALEGLRDAAPGELRVLRMELAFESGRRIEVVERGAALEARLTLSYSGGGTLRGRWQVADPGGGERPFFRTVSLVRENLSPTQRATLESPKLPTNLSGRYALRFCLETAAANQPEECADSSAGVQSLYEVRVPDHTVAITGLFPAGGDAGPGSVFRWSGVPGASIYQLQIMRAGAGGNVEFVTGVLVPGAAPNSILSQLALSKLEPGQRYRWRITAHDVDGGLLAKSDGAEFVYRP